MATPTSPARLRHAERKAKALEMRMGGASSPQIAAALGISRTTAWKLVSESLAETKHLIAERTEELRALEHARYERYIASLAPLALDGDIAAHRALVRWHERLAKLLDLDLGQGETSAENNWTIIATPPWMRDEQETVEAAEWTEGRPDEDRPQIESGEG